MNDKLIYSTNPKTLNQSEDKVFVETLEPQQQNLRIWLEKRPGNKVVSIIRDFEGPTDELKKIEKILKKKCGVGGTVKGREIIIQTKDRQKLLQILNDLGYFAKLSGG